MAAREHTRTYRQAHTQTHTRPHSIPVNAEVVAFCCRSRRVSAARQAAFPEWRSKIRTDDDAKHDGMQVNKSNSINQFKFCPSPASAARNLFSQIRRIK